jgi:hypothetical protein
MRPGNPSDAMMVLFEERAAWADLAGRYRFLYGMSLQERLATQAVDIQDWWQIGGQLELPIRVTAAERDEWLAGRPEKVRDIIIKVALETRVPVKRIMGGQGLAHYVGARHEVVRRLAAMPWRGGFRDSGHPSPQQIAQWMNLERTTVAGILSKRTVVRGG